MAEGGFSHLSYCLHPTIIALDKLDGQPSFTLRLPYSAGVRSGIIPLK